MRRYYYVVPVTKSNGNRYFTFYVDAESVGEAESAIDSYNAKLFKDDIGITWVGKPVLYDIKECE